MPTRIVTGPGGVAVTAGGQPVVIFTPVPSGAIAATKHKPAAAIAGRMHPKGTIGAAARKAVFAGSSSAATPQNHFSDNFNRADADSLGENWTNRQNAVGISGNEAYGYYDSTAYADATYNTPLASDNMRVTGVPGHWTDWLTMGGVYLWLGCNTTGQGVMGFWGGFGSSISSYQSWADASPVAQATGAACTLIPDSSQCVIERSGNVYTLKFDGNTRCTWTDSGDVIPRDSSHRLCGLGVWRQTGTYSYDHRLTSWAADDI